MSTKSHFSSYLVSPEELHRALQSVGTSVTPTSSRIIPVSAASFPPGDGRRGIDAFRERRIPGARFFDLDEVADKTSGLPHTLPSSHQFGSAMTALGIRNDDTIVVYDTYELGITSAPRAAWTFKVFGHAKVHVLNNFKRWVELGYPIESESHPSADSTESASPYSTPGLDKSRVVDFDQVREVALAHKQGNAGPVGHDGRSATPQILDARPHGRWAGTSPEPRRGLSSGHIPGSISVPVSDLLDPVTKTFLSAEQLRKVFESKNVDPTRPVITSCGSGVTAAVIDAALNAANYIGESNRRLYDGSWFEWAQRESAVGGLIDKSV